jgi:tetraacyldisaccharide 4'-kinase
MYSGRGKRGGERLPVSGLDSYARSVLNGRRGLLPQALRAMLALLAPIYCIGLEVYLLPFELGIRKRFRLPCQVICVGNLTTGGTGKTPLTQALCRALVARGLSVAILSRGYGGSFEHKCAVVSDGQRVRLTASEAGDEAYLLARTLPGVPVVVGKNRRVTGRLACEQFHPDVIVMDDGFQYWQLHRDLDVVLLNACAPFDNGWTFPRGLLREPPWHLRRAGAVVLTNVERAGPDRTLGLMARVRRLAPGRPVFTADLAPRSLQLLGGEDERPLGWVNGRRVGAISALGNPASFESMLGQLGAVVAARFRYPDHTTRTVGELESALDRASAAGADALITTEKDAVKMAPLRGSLPILVLRVVMRLDQERSFMETVLERSGLGRLDARYG